MDITRFLPQNEYDAAVNANSPSAANPYATIADVAPDGNGIYSGSGSLSSNTEVTLGTSDINFALSDNFGRFSVAPAGFAAARNIHFKCLNSNAVRVEGADDLAASRTFEAVNDSGDLIAEFYNDSDIVLSPILGVTNRSRVMIGTSAPVGNARLTVKGGSSTTGAAAFLVSNSVDDVILQVQNNGSLAMGGGTVSADTRFGIKGFGTTNANIGLKIQDSVNVTHFQVNDDGSTLMAAGGGVSGFANFANVWRATNFNTGWGFYASNVANEAVSIQMLGTTDRGLFIANQGDPTGIVKGGNTLIDSVNATHNYGFDSSARNGSAQSIGLRGLATGGATINASQFVAGIEGFSQYNLDTEQRGGYFHAVYNNSGLAYTSDLIGSVHEASGTATGAAGSTGKVVGSKHFTSGTQGSGDRIAIWVPETGNNGTVIINMDAVGVNNSTLEVNGDIEAVGSANGFILDDRTDANYYRIYVDAGVLKTEIVV